MPRVVRGGPRDQTFHRFATAIANPDSERVPLLLVDSEGPVQAGHSVWKHLQARDKWSQPDGSREDQAFLIVQFMETWLLADRTALKKHFGEQFKETALKRWPQLEAVRKKTVLDALKKATNNCSGLLCQGQGFVCIAGKNQPTLVEAACPHAKALLDRLKTL